MPSILLTAATDIFVLAGAAAVAATALNSKKVSFETCLGTECDDDPLLAAESSHAVGTPAQHAPLHKHADDDKKAPTVTVNEVAVTPPVTEMQGCDYFAGAKAA